MPIFKKAVVPTDAHVVVVAVVAYVNASVYVYVAPTLLAAAVGVAKASVSFYVHVGAAAISCSDASLSSLGNCPAMFLCNEFKNKNRVVIPPNNTQDNNYNGFR